MCPLALWYRGRVSERDSRQTWKIGGRGVKRGKWKGRISSSSVTSCRVLSHFLVKTSMARGERLRVQMSRRISSGNEANWGNSSLSLRGMGFTSCLSM